MQTATLQKKTTFLDRLAQCRHNRTVPVIAEIKAYTPKNGDLLRGRSVESIAELYERTGMACISVVTGHWFKGSSQMLKRASGVCGLPILRKDFLVSKSALDRSKELGASAVLLTKLLLDQKTLNKLADHALCLGLTPFIEVGSAEETEGLYIDSEAILAVCNRDIKTRETDDGDFTKSLDLLAAAKSTGAGMVVSASAIENAAQAKRLLESGYDALLIGTALLGAYDTERILNEFRVALNHY